MTANNPVGDLIALAERLTGLLEKESALLADARTREIAALQTDKIHIASGFEAQVARLNGDRKPLDDAEPGMRAKLVRAMSRARNAVAENARALRAARDANQKLLNAIFRALSERERKLDVYTATGGVSTSVYGKHPVVKAVPLTIDQRL
jgi:flagellar biosynthesis/type III secretory pathway chaperone